MLDVTIAKVVWLLAALSASIVVIANLFDAYQNLNYLDAAGLNGRRRILASQHIRSEIFRLSLCAIKTVVAGTSMTTYEVPLDISVIGWVTASAVILIWSLADARTRRQLRQYRQDTAHVSGRRRDDSIGPHPGRRATDTDVSDAGMRDEPPRL